MRHRMRRRARGEGRRGLVLTGWVLYARLLEELLGPSLTPEHALEVLGPRAILTARGRYACKLYGSPEPQFLSRLVMMVAVRGPLGEGAEVHHISGDRTDDRPHNLALMESHGEHVLVDGRGAGMAWVSGVGVGGRVLRFTCGPYRGMRACRGVMAAAVGARLPSSWSVRPVDGVETNIGLANLTVVSMHVRVNYERCEKRFGREEAERRFDAYLGRWPECRGQGFVDWYAAQTVAHGKRPERAPGGAWGGE